MTPIFTIITKETGQLMTHSPVWCMKENQKNWLNLMYSIYIQCLQIIYVCIRRIFGITANKRKQCLWSTVYPKKYAHGFCFAVLCCGYTLTDFPISIRLTSLALWQSNDCLSASKATLVNMDKYFMWIHYERLHNHNKAKHNKTVCIFLGIYCNIRQYRVQNSNTRLSWVLHMYIYI